MNRSMADGYESLYENFDSPLMRTLRREAYGEDIGQHSWVSADELRADMPRLNLSSSSRCLDLGCGPCGPLSFIVSTVGCRGVGVDLSAAAVRVGRARAASLGLDSRLSVEQGDLNEPLPFESGSFDVVVALDVVVHLRDRLSLFREASRLLCPGGRFLFTDAGLLTGSISNEEVRARSAQGFTQFVAAGWNETLLESAGFELIETENRTMSVVTNAGGRLMAMLAHRAELEQMSSVADVESQQHYLETVIELSRRGALSRVMYLSQTAS
jgi:SAM-dependent methyltransferase